MELGTLKKKSISHFEFHKIETNILDVDNVKLYKCAKYQCKIRIILVNTKRQI